jgi:ABC-type dipeptide/oligopeptide/nickel transport system ATPase subunit
MIYNVELCLSIEILSEESLMINKVDGFFTKSVVQGTVSPTTTAINHNPSSISPFQHVKSKVKEAWNPIAYNQHGIVALKNLQEWSKKEEELHFKHNRLLQNGFMRYNAQEVVRDAKITKQTWLTDIACPSVATALRLHTAAQLVCNYLIEPEKLDKITDNIFQSLKSQIQVWDNKIQYKASKKAGGDTQKALLAMKAIYPNLTEQDPTYLETLNAFIRLETMLRIKAATDKVVEAQLQELMPAIAQQLNIKLKPVWNIGKNEDLVLLGAMGSGKSTIARQQLAQMDERDFVMFSTDNFRGISFGALDDHSTNEQVFIKTQDSAFMVKELVQKYLLKTLAQSCRPNIIIDSIRYESWLDALFEKNKKTTVSIACLDDASQVPQRVYNRAESSTSGPADRGRHVNTEALITDHKQASERLLSALPLDMDKVELFNTNAPNRIPIKMAEVNTKRHTLNILKLDDFAKFMCKINLNPKANSKSELYYQTDKKVDRFTFTAKHQAGAILTTIPKNRFKAEYSIILCDKECNPYATITTAGMVLNEHGSEIFAKMRVNQDISKWLTDKDKSILKQLVVQTSRHKDKKYLCADQQFSLAFYDQIKASSVLSQGLFKPEVTPSLKDLFDKSVAALGA